MNGIDFFIICGLIFMCAIVAAFIGRLITTPKNNPSLHRPSKSDMRSNVNVDSLMRMKETMRKHYFTKCNEDDYRKTRLPKRPPPPPAPPPRVIDENVRAMIPVLSRKMNQKGIVEYALDGKPVTLDGKIIMQNAPNDGDCFTYGFVSENWKASPPDKPDITNCGSRFCTPDEEAMLLDTMDDLTQHSTSEIARRVSHTALRMPDNDLD